MPVVLIDAQDRFRFANHAAEQFLGMSTSQLAQLKLSDLVPLDNPLFLLIDQVRQGDFTVSDHDLTLDSPRLRKVGITVQGIAAAGGARRGAAGDAGRLGRARAGPAAGVPRRRPQRDRHGGDAGA